jgi:hypothetical protein
VSPPPPDTGENAGDLDVVLVVDENGADVGGENRARCASCRPFTRRAQAAIRQASLRASRRWGAQGCCCGVAPFVGNPLNIEDIDLATPQQSGAIICSSLPSTACWRR